MPIECYNNQIWWRRWVHSWYSSGNAQWKL